MLKFKLHPILLSHTAKIQNVFNMRVCQNRHTLLIFFYRTPIIDLYEFLENLEKYWLEVNKETQKSPPKPTLFDIIW